MGGTCLKIGGGARIRLPVGANMGLSGMVEAKLFAFETSTWASLDKDEGSPE